MTAHDYFRDVRRAARDLAALDERLETMHEPRIASPLASGSGGGDPMARYDAAVDAEPGLLRHKYELEGALDDARLVIAGIGAELGYRVELALTLHYLRSCTWEDVGFELHASLSTCYRWRRSAFDLYESRGHAALRDAGAGKS
jgi:hypothetical protein